MRATVRLYEPELARKIAASAGARFTVAARKQQGIMTNSWSTLAFFKSPTLANAATAVPAGRSQLMRDILEIGDVSIIFRSAYDRDDIFARAFDMSAARLRGQACLAHGIGGEAVWTTCFSTATATLRF